MTKQVVILGGGFAGIGIAHKLLKHTVPKAKGVKVTLISASSHLYWNLAAVRGVIPGEISDEALFTPIADGFKRFPASQFEFLVGTASTLDTTSNLVHITTEQGVRAVGYDHLVVATGSSTTTGLPFKHLSSYEDTIDSLHDLQSRIKAAKSIIIAGGGATGVETAGELGFAYGRKKEITLVVEGPRVLSGLRPEVGKAAENYLQKLNVHLVHNVKVTESEASDVKQVVTLSNGKTLTADVYLPLFGVKPNTDFIPAHLLDVRGNLQLQNTLRVVGLSNVWGVGDVGNLENKQAMKAETQVIHLAKNLDAVLTGHENLVKQYKVDDKPMIFVTTGKKKGTGQMGTMKAPSFLVSYAKGRTLFLDKAPGLVAGKHLVSSSV
ncbi:hypothetical protein EDB81DRAFT_689229 [Dactylonectria macrodidyma]|uniref:FAD/NAD(P)-binding domain-containing protein n=1 Tax=Dactylonectria macrodidyma TaxID=307937 RepID=A0A9P9EV15_9HYPO|nr:hypothetical protein EDB81DRAFT_689229 [Dactylonectria macrodidyma]